MYQRIGGGEGREKRNIRWEGIPRLRQELPFFSCSVVTSDAVSVDVCILRSFNRSDKMEREKLVCTSQILACLGRFRCRLEMRYSSPFHMCVPHESPIMNYESIISKCLSAKNKTGDLCSSAAQEACLHRLLKKEKIIRERKIL